MSTNCRHPLPHSGTNQVTRLLSALSPGSVNIDAHQVEDLMVYAHALSQQVCYWNYTELNQDHLDGNWSVFWASDPLFLLAAIAATDTQAIEKQYKKIEEQVLKLLSFQPDDSCETDPRPEAIRRLVNHIYHLAAQIAYWGEQQPGHPPLTNELAMMVRQQLRDPLCALVAYDLGTPGQVNDYTVFLGDKNEHPFAQNWGLNYLPWTQIDPIATADEEHVIDGDVILPLRDLFKKFLKVMLRLRARAKAQLTEAKNGPRDHQPHIALFLAFLDLFNTLQVQLNGLSAQHLDYYYGQILQISKQQAAPDYAHLVFQMAVGAVRERLEAGTLFRAGKDLAGKDRQYILERDLTLNRGKVAEIQTLYVGVDTAGQITMLRHEHILDTDKKNSVPDKIEAIRPFYSLGQPGGTAIAPVGFAIASGQFETSACTRTFNLSFIHNQENTPDIGQGNWADFFKLEISTEKAWLPLAKGTEFTVGFDGTLMLLTINLTKSHPAITALSEGSVMHRDLPVLRMYLTDAAFTATGSNNVVNVSLLNWLQSLIINKITISTQARNITDFRLEEGNSGIALPSTQNIWVNRYRGMGLRLYAPEMFAKNGSFSISNNLKVVRAINDGTLVGGTLETEDYIEIPSIKDYALGFAVNWGALYGNTDVISTPAIPIYWGPSVGFWGNYNSYSPAFIPTVSPLLVDTMASRGVNPPPDNNPQLVSPPRGNANRSYWFDFVNPGNTVQGEFGPTTEIQRYLDLELEYSSEQVIFESTPSGDNGVRLDDNLDHFYYLGTTESYWELPNWHVLTNNQKQPFALLPTKAQYPHFRRPEPITGTPDWANGNLFIGLSGQVPGQMASLLFQVVEGSEENYCKTPEIEWSYLKDNCWQRFPPGMVTYDSTRGDENSRRSLVQSGIVELQIPADATTNDSLIRRGMVWVRASAVERAGESVLALPKLAAIHAQAGRVRLHTLEVDATHFDAALPAETISQLQVRRANVRKTEQKYPGFGGQAPEPAIDWYLRVSERLRHKRRAITLWDYERLVLEQFPNVRTAKCVNHSHLVTGNDGLCAANATLSNNECANGHVTVVVLPYLTDYSVQNPFTPQPSAALLEQVSGYLRPCANMFVGDLWHSQSNYLHVVRPDYQQVAVSLNVKFKPELTDTEIWKFQLDTDIARFISPWAFDEKIGADFKRSVDRMEVLFFLENLDYVDYVTDLYIGIVGNGIMFKENSNPIEHIAPAHEGAILTTFIRPIDVEIPTDLAGATNLPIKTLFTTNHLITVL
jgi:hypothetical protein